MGGDRDSSRRPGEPEAIAVTMPINLGQFIKVAGMVSTGGEAKYVIASGLVLVNEEVETRRGRKLAPDDIVAYGQSMALVSTNRPLPPGSSA